MKYQITHNRKVIEVEGEDKNFVTEADSVMNYVKELIKKTTGQDIKGPISIKKIIG